MKLRLTIVLTALVISAWLAPSSVSSSEKQVISLSELGSRDRLAALFYFYSSSNLNLDHLDYWVQQLDNSRPLKSDGTLPPDLAVRDVAVTCLEAMTGSELSLIGQDRRLEVKEIITYRKADTPWRFQISALDDKQFAQIKIAATRWADGYKHGAETAARKKKSSRSVGHL